VPLPACRPRSRPRAGQAGTPPRGGQEAHSGHALEREHGNNGGAEIQPCHGNASQNSRSLLGGKHKNGGDKENGRDTAKWHGVSFQSVRLWNEKVLNCPVQHLGSLDLGLKERNNRSHPVSEDLPDFFHVFVLHLNPVQDEIDGVFSNLVFLD